MHAPVVSVVHGAVRLVGGDHAAALLSHAHLMHGHLIHVVELKHFVNLQTLDGLNLEFQLLWEGETAV